MQSRKSTSKAGYMHHWCRDTIQALGPASHKHADWAKHSALVSVIPLPAIFRLELQTLSQNESSPKNIAEQLSSTH